MDSGLLNRLHAILLALATIGIIVLAVFNFNQEVNFQQPDDGVWWTEAGPGTGLHAEKVLPDSPGEHAGVKPHDRLTAVNENPVRQLSDLERELYRTGSYGNAKYEIVRSGVSLETRVIPEPLDRSLALGLRVIGIVYLAIGLYVLFRRWTAPRATHFYLFCLVSFAFYALKYTGALDSLDWTVFWTNIVAESLQPALFLHFALSFPQERLQQLRRRWLLPIVYLPGAALLVLWLWAMTAWQATGLLKHRLDQTGTAYDAIYYVLATLLFLRSYAKADTPVLRQQLKWLTRGASLAVVPFTLFYAVPFLFDVRMPSFWHKLAGLSLIFLPLTFSWAIVRFRLMDTDLIFKRGVAYTLATGLVLGGYFGIIALTAGTLSKKLPESVRDWGSAFAILIVVAAFEPLKRKIQSWVDRIYDRHKYDYRLALVDFGRGLSSEKNLVALLDAIVERLPRTLLVARVAVFLSDAPGQLRLAASHGMPPELSPLPNNEPHLKLDYTFLDFDRTPERSHIFLENTQQTYHLMPLQQVAAATLDLNYYLPCRVQDANGKRTIAVIGLGRTIGGDFLSSEDIELLESLASYIGIALQNAILYSRLEEKITEFERLKEFNENIVESINVGILAVDLEGRIESWNAQMEAMYALSRGEALGNRLNEVFPAEFADGLESFGNEPGVHHLYKFRMVSRAGEQRTVNAAIAPLLSRDFVPVGRIILVDDITERVALESQLAQSDKLSSIGLLAAGVAHEINTPLAVVSSYAQMLSKQLKGDQRLGPVLDKIIQQSFRASEIASGLLNFSRTATTEFRDTDLNHVIRDTLSLVEHQLKKSAIEVDLQLDEKLPAINGNQGKLQQVFLNLLLNAKDAMPEGGRLHISTQVNGHVQAIIRDSGSGIAQENLKRIFDPFFTTKTQPKPGDRRGTGLGLSVTYGIMQEHAGKIHVESEVGAGAAFHLEFPLLRNTVHV